MGRRMTPQHHSITCESSHLHGTLMWQSGAHTQVLMHGKCVLYWVNYLPAPGYIDIKAQTLTKVKMHIFTSLEGTQVSPPL